MARLIDGKAIAAQMAAQTADQVRDLVTTHGKPPGLAVVLIGNDPASEVYVERKIKECDTVGIRSFEHRLPTDIEQDRLLQLVVKLNADPDVHGILVQLPLPDHIDAVRVLNAISPTKDVDGFHPVNVGRLSIGARGLVPCTPLGVMMLLDSVIEDYRGLDAVVIGKSNIVGKPVAMLLLEREATVTVTHIETLGLAEAVRQADIVIAAAGAPFLVKGYWVKAGAVVIDVGINRISREGGGTRLVGDVAFDEMQHVRAISPVPGGVGPMTIACLLTNTVKAMQMTAGIADPDIRQGAFPAPATARQSPDSESAQRRRKSEQALDRT